MDTDPGSISSGGIVTNCTYGNAMTCSENDAVGYYRQYKIGYVLEDNTPDGIAQLVESLDPREASGFKNNLNAFNKIYNWEEQEKTLARIYAEL